MEILFKIKSPADFPTTFSNFSDVGNISLKKVGNMSENVWHCQNYVRQCQKLADTCQKTLEIVKKMSDFVRKMPDFVGNFRKN